MQKEIIIPNPERFDEILKVIREGGSGNLHVLADFDRTLTTAFVDGVSVPSLISVLRDGNYLTPDYAEKSNALAKEGQAIENDLSLSFEVRYAAMEKWWRNHFQLLIASGLTRSDIEKVISSAKVQLREGFSEFASLLHAHNVPLAIMSSSGLGSESIELFLKHEGKFSDNMHIIGNEYVWDEQGRAISVREPIIHLLNKHETAIQDYPAFDMVRERKNVVLLGDSTNDIGMVQGFDYNSLLSIGFFNEATDENLKHYEKTFDVTLTGDASLTYVNKILQKILL